MDDRVRQQFRAFVEEHTPALFAEAYALAGRQDAAEELLRAGLERTLARWGRVDDPYAHTVQELRRRSVSWWRRRLAGAEPPAPEGSRRGRPVNLADLAIDGLRRRRLIRIVAAAAAVPVLVAAVVVPWQLQRDDSTPDEVDLTGHSVVAAYRDAGLRVLNPETGDYQVRHVDPGLASPDLRRTARWAGQQLIIESTVDDSRVETGPLPLDDDVSHHPPVHLAWSPDSTRLAVTPFAPTGPFPTEPFQVEDELVDPWDFLGSDDVGYRQVLLVDADSGESAIVELDFPDGHAGWPADLTGVFWLDDGQLAVPTMRTGELVPDRAVSEQWGEPLEQLLIVGVSVFDDTGAYVTHLPIDTGELQASSEPDVSLMWAPTGLVRDGRFLLTRTPEPGQIELAAVDLAADPGPYSGVVADVTPPAPDGATLIAWPFAWLPDGRVIVDGYPASGLADVVPPIGHTSQVLVVDLSGEWHHTGTLARELAPGSDIPPTAQVHVVGDAAALSPEAATRRSGDYSG